MDKKTFMDLTGENPEDMFGSDWQNEINDIMTAGIINPCRDCGVEVDNLDNEICDPCWDKFETRLARYNK